MRRRYVAIGLTIVNVIFLLLAIAWPSGGDERVATIDPDAPTPTVTIVLSEEEQADPEPQVLSEVTTPTLVTSTTAPSTTSAMRSRVELVPMSMAATRTDYPKGRISGPLRTQAAHTVS